MSVSIPKENSEQEERYLIALVKNKKVAFTARWVREIIVIQRSQILSLPFYDRAFLGIVHHQNKIVPLISGRKVFLEEARQVSQATFTAVCLNDLGEKLTGVGIIVDRMVENISSLKLTHETIFQLTDIPNNIWQPQR